MIEITNKEDCCGCSACASICPRKCITMTTDVEGFDYPKVEVTNCVQCGMCEKICPILNKRELSERSSEGYIAYSKNFKERINSSSGGIFIEVANEILSSSGIVFGAAFDEQYLVKHVMIDTKEDLQILQGSKYLQSTIGNAYQTIEVLLNDNKEVLFVGTACQVAGLKGYLKKDYDNLFTVDVLCHGVPSPKVWKKYLEEIRHNRSISAISFRNKDTGWKNYSIDIQFDDGSSEKTKYWDNIYMRLFLENLSLRPSCYACKFKGIPRVSDITLGDCWGVEKHSPDMDDNKGTSVILVHSQKGKSVLSSIISKIEIKEADIDLILPASADSRRSVSIHPKREKFFRDLNTVNSLEEFYKLLTPGIKSRIKGFIKSLIK